MRGCGRGREGGASTLKEQGRQWPQLVRVKIAWGGVGVGLDVHGYGYGYGQEYAQR